MSRGAQTRPRIALGRRITNCPLVRSLGVRPNFGDYTPEEQSLILEAPKVYFPSAFYADLLDTLGKPTFPSYHTYKYAQDKIRQTALFNMAGIRHPRTRVFYGPRQKARIADFFDLPLIAKQARGSSQGRGVFLIRCREELVDYLNRPGPAYIQEFLPFDRDIRVVIIGRKVAHAYWRIAPGGDFRTNLSTGGEVDLSPVPEEALELALHTARFCRWDDVGIDICACRDRYYVLEGNMKYGHKGFLAAGIDYQELLARMIATGDI